MGSMERFFGILIEHYGGAFPLWLSPVQAVVIPVADRHLPYARETGDKLAAEGFRVEVDDSANSMQKKIRENAKQKVPYLLVVGDAEEGEGTVNVRKRGEKTQEAVGIEEFAERMRAEVAVLACTLSRCLVRPVLMAFGLMLPASPLAGAVILWLIQRQR